MSSNGRDRVAVRVESLGKKYHIGVRRERYQTLRDRLAHSVAAPVRRARKLLSGHATGAAELDEVIWALKGVSFEVPRGEVIGIIGRNGAGKSTLLKILSRITEPTEGYAEIRGRISSLLEVGTGFHPELTGRENVYLNGAILAMKRAEIDRKFDEIVAFSEVEKFIDTPVKHYSSGMRVRLAFAVAAHLEPEILVIDEVLSVGDAAFQKKCLGKMGTVAETGRTVLFVSHNMGAVDSLCTRAMWLDEGRIVKSGEVGEVVSAYLRGTSSPIENGRSLRRLRPSQGAQVKRMRILDAEGNACDTFLMGESIVVEFDIDFSRTFTSVHLALEVRRMDTGQHVLHMVNEDCGLHLERVTEGMHTFRVVIPECMLYPTDYRFLLCVSVINARTDLDYVQDPRTFTVIQSGVSKRTRRLSQHRDAVFYVASRWEKVC